MVCGACQFRTTIEVQATIADTLSAYDDLIENNRRRMALLEESARLLYREWFVRLRFPGHEHTRIIDGVPEGWERTTFEDALVLQRGFDLPTQAQTSRKLCRFMVPPASSDTMTRPKHLHLGWLLAEAEPWGKCNTLLKTTGRSTRRYGSKSSGASPRCSLCFCCAKWT